MLRAGIAITRATPTPTISTGMRKRTTKRPHAAPAAVDGSVADRRAIRSACPTRPVFSLVRRRGPTKWVIFSPAKPSRAGSRVSAISTEMSTAAAATRPIVRRKGMPTTLRPTSATITVAPANTTALPAVPTAVATDSSIGLPASSWDRCLDKMNTP